MAVKAIKWGQNTVHTIATPTAPPPMTFGTPTPTGGGLIGSMPAPAASTTGAFGTPSPAPAPRVPFAAPSPAPALFGSSPAPASSLVGFGTPTSATFQAPSAFVAPPTLFGGTPVASNPQQQIPAQAALQAHLNASARQESERVRAALERLNAAYTGTVSSIDGSTYVVIVYNELTPEQRQLQWLHGMGNGGQILAPDRPAEVSEKVWKKAVVDNPNPQEYMPIALVGGVALQGRVSWQQERAKELASSTSTLHQTGRMIMERLSQTSQDIEETAGRQNSLKKRLLDVMRRVELARCMNQQIQPDEFNALQRLTKLLTDAELARGVFLALRDRARVQTSMVMKALQDAGAPDKAQLLSVMKEQRLKLEKLANVTSRDERDVGLISHRVYPNVAALHGGY